MEHPLERDFSVGDVFSDAFTSFKDRIGTHIGFNAVFIAGLIGVTCLLGCAMAILLGILFVIGFPGLQGAAMDRGLVLFGAAIVLGIAATITVIRAKRASA